MASAGKVLIVEDQFFVAVDSEMHLRLAGFDCVGLASDANEAYRLAFEQHPDIIVMDIRLASDSSGIRAATAIYRDLGIRCIFASGHTDRSIREEAEDAHPLGWLDKPYSGAQLVTAVREAFAGL